MISLSFSAVAWASAFSASIWAFLALSCMIILFMLSALAGTASFLGKRKLRA